MVNLIEQLSEEDKVKLNNYINLYGVKDEYFIGVDSWLENWAKNKTKLYKLLGNQFIYKVPYKKEKDEVVIKYQIKNLIDNDNDFIVNFRNWLYYYKREKQEESDYYNFISFYNFCTNLINTPSIFVADKLTEGIKFKDNRINKKELQLQKGMKPIRALSKIINYYDGYFENYDIKEKFEKFRIEHSIIFNDKIIKGNLCISIHPLDFITISDNSLNWKSCMSWTDKGCYRVGTIEMMNSNNVVCCYLESKEPYYFDCGQEQTAEYSWNNKRWRQLCYITKDIIVSGKAYPYANDELSKELITILRELADKNLNWQYSFGVERYLDMKHINSFYGMESVRDYIRYKNTKKYNIIFDSKGMYNDMLNDNDTKYWCVRNKVKHNKIISYSGKCNCLCCNNKIIYFDDDNYADYNERYRPTDSVICEECLDNYFTCNYCNEADTSITLYRIKSRNNQKLICQSCWDTYVRICPHCGEPMLIPKYDEAVKIKAFVKPPYFDDDIKKEYFDFYNSEREYSADKSVVPIFMHYSCAKELGATEESYIRIYSWGRENKKEYLKLQNNLIDYSKYYYTNLQKIPYQEELEITKY